jgi:hypothetical protein
MLPLLAEAGLRFLHIGVNSASTPPAVPPVFVWRGPEGAEVLVMYHKGSYGDLMIVPGLDEAIAFAHTNDNLGPQTPEGLRAIYQAYRVQFPEAEIAASTMNAYATALETVKSSLPVVMQELGNTWIHGVASDPLKVARFRELQRLRAQWLAQGQADPQDPRFQAFSRALLLVAEHTWGLDEKVHLADPESWSSEMFRAARSRPNYRKMEASWEEQRAYLDQAVQALEGSPLAGAARQALAALEPSRPEKTGFAKVHNFRQPFETAYFRIAFDEHGALVRLDERGSRKAWASPDFPLGLFLYETFSQADYDRFYRQYVVNKRQVAVWAIPDFTKPGIGSAGAVHAEWLPRLHELQPLSHLVGPEGHRFLLELAMPVEPIKTNGCPARLTIEVFFPDAAPEILWTLQWFDKPASRLPEACWFSFCPRVSAGRGWQIEKMGRLISPLEVVKNGSRSLHAVDRGIYYDGPDGRLALESPDAPLVAPGRRSLLEFNNRQPPLRQGMHFLLQNNLWGTNHPMWYEDDAKFRLYLKVDSIR